jgi:hypothetical protein
VGTTLPLPYTTSTDSIVTVIRAQTQRKLQLPQHVVRAGSECEVYCTIAGPFTGKAHQLIYGTEGASHFKGGLNWPRGIIYVFMSDDFYGSLQN